MVQNYYPLLLLIAFAHIDIQMVSAIRWNFQCKPHLLSSIVLVISKSNVSTRSCTGSIMSRNYVLTAGYCCEDGQNITVYSGFDSQAATWEQEIPGASEVRLRNRVDMDMYQICILDLVTSLRMTKRSKSLMILNAAEFRELKKKKNTAYIDVLGFGRMGDIKNDTNFTLLCGVAPYTQEDICDEHFDKYKRDLDRKEDYICLKNWAYNNPNCRNIVGSIAIYRSYLLAIVLWDLKDCLTAQYMFLLKIESQIPAIMSFDKRSVAVGMRLSNCILGIWTVLMILGYFNKLCLNYI